MLRVRVFGLDAHRDALRNLDPVTRRVLRRKKREGRAAAAAQALHNAMELAIRINVRLDDGFLARTKRGKFGFLEVGIDPVFLIRDDHEEGHAWLHGITWLQCQIGNYSVHWGHQVSPFDIKLRLAYGRDGRLYGGILFAAAAKRAARLRDASLCRPDCGLGRD